jgi:hypothetical protein
MLMPQDIFSQFAEKNKKVFADMGVSPASIGFKTLIDNGVEQVTHAHLLERLAASKTFPASIDQSSTRKVDEIEHRTGAAMATRAALEQKIRTSIIVPVLVAATAYLVIMLLI